MGGPGDPQGTAVAVTDLFTRVELRTLPGSESGPRLPTTLRQTSFSRGVGLPEPAGAGWHRWSHRSGLWDGTQPRSPHFGPGFGSRRRNRRFGPGPGSRSRNRRLGPEFPSPRRNYHPGLESLSRCRSPRFGTQVVGSCSMSHPSPWVPSSCRSLHSAPWDVQWQPRHCYEQFLQRRPHPPHSSSPWPRAA